MRAIILDAGHGGNDPGTICPGMTEKQANLETVLTIKHLLTELGLPVLLTRGDDTRPTYAARQAVPADALVYISVHFNMPGSYGLVYYQDGRPQSRALADVLATESGLSRVWSSRMSNHNGLYIDAVRVPAVMLEVAAIDAYPQDVAAARAYRVHVAQAVIRALIRWSPPLMTAS